MERLLKIEGLCVSVDAKTILHDVNLTIPQGEVHALLGPNGSGKTSLMMTVMGRRRYRVDKGRIFFGGEDITDMDVTERNRLGIGVAEQRPPSIPGVKLRQVLDRITAEDLRRISEAKAFVKDFGMEAMLDREVNAGLSGGEIKRSELLQLLAARPRLAMMDEPDSGVDVESLKLMGDMIDKLFCMDSAHPAKRRSGIIITHKAQMLKYVRVDKAHVMLDGRIECSGNPDFIFDTVNRCGYRECIRCVKENRELGTNGKGEDNG